MVAGDGIPQGEREGIEVNIADVTRQFRRLPHHLNGDLFASIAANPQTKRGGVILAQEGNIWTVTMNTYHGTVPTELQGFIDFAKTLSSSYIYDVVSRAEPVGEARAARFPASIRRRYERMHRFPKVFLLSATRFAASILYTGRACRSLCWRLSSWIMLCVWTLETWRSGSLRKQQRLLTHPGAWLQEMIFACLK